MYDLSQTHVFKPELLSRRAEFTSWILAVVMLVTWWILQANQAVFSGTALVLFIFLLVAAFGTSLGNWMDRKSSLELGPQGIAFRNGLRDVQLAWNEILKVQVFPSAAGSQRVQVLGNRSHFEYRTLAELSMNGEVKGRSGYAAGDRILDTILQAAHLSKQQTDAAYTYYARD